MLLGKGLITVVVVLVNPLTRVVTTNAARWDDRELKDGMVIAITNVEDDEKVLHTVVDKPEKQHTTYDGFQLPRRHISRGINMGSKVQYKPKKQVYQGVSKKNGVSSSGKKVIHEVVDSAFGSSSTTPLVARINELEMLPSSSNVASKKVDYPINEDSDDVALEGKFSKNNFDRIVWLRLQVKCPLPLSLEISKWVAAYTAAYSRKTSGMSLKDVELDAHKIYEGDGSKFLDLIIFNEVMCKHPKWKLNLDRDKTRLHLNEESGGSTKNRRAPKVSYVVNGHQRNMAYYLIDGIYPSWAAFVKSITSPQIRKHKLFAQHPEAVRKDVERAFGVLASGNVPMGDKSNEVIEEDNQKEIRQIESGKENINANEEVCDLHKVTNDEDACNSHSINMSSQIKSKILTDGFSMIDKFNEIMSLNVQGIGRKEKKKWVKDLCFNNAIQFLSVQETKKSTFSCMAVRLLWGNGFFYYSMAPAIGASGGILCVWDKNSFQMTREVIDNSFVALKGLWLLTNTPILIVSIYSPQEIGAKKVLWDRIVDIIKCWNGEVIIMGDFNEVLDSHERFGSTFNSHHASIFKEFLSNAEVVDVPLDGYMFTWWDRAGSKMSKIDRFLVSEGLLETFPHFSGMILTRHLSDHRPILLHEVVSDFSPKPFRIFGSWFLEDDFQEVVEDAWNNEVVADSNAMESMDLAQKAKINWAIEGDENSKYFHGIINKKRGHNAIRGVLIDGDWVNDPMRVKQEFYNHFASVFDALDWKRPSIDT
ncbi:RNA-directed DNA polymerase, eukaryota [Tanacetum coccineum]